MRKIPALLVRLVALAALASTAGAAEPEAPRVAPELRGERWLNSAPLRMQALRGRVVLVEFWTFACWNCQNVEPHVKAWHAKYQAAGLRVIGVHCPELDRERELANLRAYVREHGIAYPVLIDNAFRTWRAYGNRYWPALYLVDKRGLIRHVAIGEGRYAETEAKIRELLAEQLHKSESGTFLRKSALELQGGSSQGAANPRRAAATVSAW